MQINSQMLKQLSLQYNVPVEDVLFITLNRCGVIMNTDETRIRFNLKLKTYPETFYFAVGVNTFNSPFSINDGLLYLGEEVLGDVVSIEKDTCTASYFRNGKTHITLNSNSRSNCKGCKFCGTYNLDADDKSDLSVEQNLRSHIEEIISSANLRSLDGVNGITVCTGCFPSEQRVIDHLVYLKKVLRDYGFNKKLNYIGSQIRSDEALARIKEEIEDFSLFITTEKFTDRESIMHPQKAGLNVEKTVDLIDKSVAYGFDTTILYILGLESLDIFKSNMELIGRHVNKFPTVQIFQNYTGDQEVYRCEEAKDLSYYLKARKILEDIFSNTDLAPESWENYRSLYYTQYRKRPHRSVKAQDE